MRSVVILASVIALAPSLRAQPAREEPPKVRYGIPPDPRNYPQDTAKATLASVLHAIEKQRINYLLAHLADPEFVDERVQRYGGNFDLLVRETATKLGDNPDSVKELGRFLREGDWQGNDTMASATLKDVKDRKVFLRKIGSRWFLENQQKAAAAAPAP